MLDKIGSIYGNYIDEVLRITDPSNYTYYYLHDHLYSPAALLNTSGNVVERYEYDVYGKCRIMDASYNSRSTSSYENCYLFTGRRLDILDGGSLTIQYNRNRYYDPETGRWLTHDPLGYVDGMNPYEYVRSDPIGRWDAFGLTDCEVVVGIHAVGKDEGAFKRRATDFVKHYKEELKAARPILTSFRTGADFLAALKEASKGKDFCIKMLGVFTHGWSPVYSKDPQGEQTLTVNRGGIYSTGVGDYTGFYTRREEGDSPNARYVQNDLYNAVNSGDIKFCSPCKSVFNACRLGMSAFPYYWTKVTGCDTYVGLGGVSPVESGGKEIGLLSGPRTTQERTAARNTGMSYLGWQLYHSTAESIKVDQPVGRKYQNDTMITWIPFEWIPSKEF